MNKQEKEIEELSMQYCELLRRARKEQLRNLAVELALGFDNERWLMAAVAYMAGLQDKELNVKSDVYSLVEKGGVA